MKINEFTTITTPRLLLVPYSAHHVPTYHSWMQDPDLQKATASEPLTLEEEYQMQTSWRTDTDKLTFIICTHDSATTPNNNPTPHPDTTDNMIGDVNLFLLPDPEADPDADPSLNHPLPTIGELEIMIASTPHRALGYATEALRFFLSYIQSNLPRIGAEFAGARGMQLAYLRVKIDAENERSVRLFERVGFVGTGEGVNYFGEVELRMEVVGGRLEVGGEVGEYRGQ